MNCGFPQVGCSCPGNHFGRRTADFEPIARWTLDPRRLSPYLRALSGCGGLGRALFI